MRRVVQVLILLVGVVVGYSAAVVFAPGVVAPSMTPEPGERTDSIPTSTSTTDPETTDPETTDPEVPESAPVVPSAPTGEGAVHGIVWFDRNGNGRFDPREWLLPGVTVQLTPTSGAASVGAGVLAGSFGATAVTAADGSYAFEHLAPGTYHYEVRSPDCLPATGTFSSPLAAPMNLHLERSTSPSSR